ncbi:type II secretion system secretin GspD [Bradyrhizobium sp.]|uniref:type II secretion system secretin GspD n=1 Tax=Bradyrhizobium sp. TaxID=376 RepID=UPI003C753757
MNFDRTDTPGPDVVDRVRSLDLLPRFPRQTGSTGDGATDRAKPTVYAAAADGPPAPAPQLQSTPARDGYELSFENAPIATVAKTILGEILGLGYTIDPRVQGTVSLTSGRLVPKSDLLYVLENALRPIGVVIVKDTLGYRLIPLGDAVGSGNTDTVAGRAAPGYGISVVPLEHASAQTLIKLIDSFATRPGTVRADPTRNMLIIQGSGAERRAAIDTILSFDADWMRGQLVGIYPIQNSTPEPILADLEKILDSGEGGLSQNVVKFQAIGRMNAILVVARKPEMLKTVGAWIQRLDRTDATRSGVRVYHVKYGEARQMARILNEVFIGGGSGSLDPAENLVAPGSGLSGTSSIDRLSGGGAQAGFGGRQQPGFGATDARSGPGFQGFPASRPNLAATALNPADAAEGRGAVGGAAAVGQPLLQGVRITADAVNNTLLINATQENYRIIERTLHQIDRPQLQVAIDATIAEVTLNDNLSYGVQSFLTSRNLGLGPDKGSILNSPAGTAPSIVNGVANAFLNRAIPGFNFLVGPEAQPNLILDALHTVTDLKVLSNPSLVVIDNQVATLVVGDQVPISTGSANVLNSATATSNTIINSVDYRPTGIIVRVAPRINANGNVRLEIEQEISNVVTSSNSNASSTAQPNLTPTVSQRKVKSSVVVASGQTVLLAGLIQEQSEKDRSGIPLLDDIPNVGILFSRTTRTAKRTELIIFIRPQIIRDGVDAYSIAEELRTKLRGRLGTGSPGEPRAEGR